MDYLEARQLGMGKSMTLLWLRTKSRDLMEIANAIKPDPEADKDSPEWNIFLDLLSVYGAIDACIDMVEETETLIWEAQADNAKHKLTIQQLQRKLKMYEDQFDLLDEDLEPKEND